MIRDARCACGALRLRCSGDPVSVSICHCVECRRRTGSAFGVQVRFGRAQVEVEGTSRSYVRRGDSGGRVELHFCGTCGSTVFWAPDGLPDQWVVALGAFDDPAFATPRTSVYEARRLDWVELSALQLERID